jgi:hypothetical protein
MVLLLAPAHPGRPAVEHDAPAPSSGRHPYRVIPRHEHVAPALPAPPRFGTIDEEWRRRGPPRRPLVEIVPRDDPRVVALSAALQPYGWAGATPEMLSRRVLGVLDRCRLLGELQGPRPARWMDDLGPADRGDERVAVLVEALGALHWRALTRPALCRQLVSVLESWSVRRRMTDIELGWLLDGDV